MIFKLIGGLKESLENQPKGQDMGLGDSLAGLSGQLGLLPQEMDRAALLGPYHQDQLSHDVGWPSAYLLLLLVNE